MLLEGDADPGIALTAGGTGPLACDVHQIC
jgi:hypothetical protein